MMNGRMKRRRRYVCGETRHEKSIEEEEEELKMNTLLTVEDEDCASLKSCGGSVAGEKSNY